MNVFKILKRLERDEDGAVTVDWVVLTAAVVGLGLAALAVVRGGVGTQSTAINNAVGGDIINTSFGDGDGGDGGDGGDNG